MFEKLSLIPIVSNLFSIVIDSTGITLILKWKKIFVNGNIHLTQKY